MAQDTVWGVVTRNGNAMVILQRNPGAAPEDGARKRVNRLGVIKREVVEKLVGKALEPRELVKMDLDGQMVKSIEDLKSNALVAILNEEEPDWKEKMKAARKEKAKAKAEAAKAEKKKDKPVEPEPAPEPAP
jgi:outer membrane murein-binding lipoprotein Lpp